MNEKIRLGDWGEEISRKFLIQNGVQLISNKVRNSYGEIDILGIDEEMLVFFEVKTRRSGIFGFPEISVDQKKQRTLMDTALKFIQDHPEFNMNWRIDVLSVNISKTNKPEIRWFKNAVSG